MGSLGSIQAFQPKRGFQREAELDAKGWRSKVGCEQRGFQGENESISWPHLRKAIHDECLGPDGSDQAHIDGRQIVLLEQPIPVNRKGATRAATNKRFSRMRPAELLSAGVLEAHGGLDESHLRVEPKGVGNTRQPCPEGDAQKLK